MKQTKGEYTLTLLLGTEKFSSPEEASMSRTFTSGNIIFLKNEISMATQLLVNMEADPMNPVKFLLERENLRGQILAYEYLLACHEASIDAQQS